MPREPNQTFCCAWCAERFECSRSDAKTCGPRCRSRLATYTREAGFPPDEPPGQLTAQQALDLLIFELLQREKKRRELVTLENRLAAEKLFGQRKTTA